MKKDVSDYGLSLLPYQFLLRSKSWEVRKTATEELYQSGGLPSCSLLRQSLNDPDERVRLFAAQALELTSAQYQSSLEKLRDDVINDPTDILLRLETAALICEFVTTCINSVEIKRHLLLEAKDHLVQARALDPNSPGVKLQLGEILFQLGELQSAREVLESIGSDENEFIRARFKLAEIAFEEGIPKTVRSEFVRITKTDLTPELLEVVSYWNQN